MSAFRLVQISDMHLSRVDFFVHNRRVVLEQIKAASPHLVVSTGNLPLNGSEDFEYVRDQLQRSRAPNPLGQGNRVR